MKKTPKGHVPVAETFDWPDAPTAELLQFILDTKRESQVGAVSVDKHRVPEAFKEHAADCLVKFGYTTDPEAWRYWIGCHKEGENGHKPGWCHGFPHSHKWEGLTLVHYVQVADKGGALSVVEDDRETLIKRFEPKVGTSSLVDGWTFHGVEEVFGRTPRLTLIATGYPPK